jgi:preprotein translocase SecE subunit
MAETPKDTPKAKRKVKNPETFRERALKATTEDDKPKKPGIFKKVRRIIAKPFVVVYRAIVNFPVFKPLKRPLRILGKILIPPYFRNSWKELKLVTWPSMRESIRLTYAVLIFAIIFGTSVAIVDYGLDSLFKHILLK